MVVPQVGDVRLDSVLCTLWADLGLLQEIYIERWKEILCKWVFLIIRNI